MKQSTRILSRRFALLVRLGLLALFLVLPLASLAVMGQSAPYTQRSHTPWPSPLSLLSHENAGREALASAFLDRLVLRRELISWRNRLYAPVFSYVDTTMVVSGKPGILVYKPSLEAWDCRHLNTLQHAADRLELILEIAAAAEAPFHLAIAPNKATIEPDARAGRARLYGSCYEAVRDRLEAAIAPYDRTLVIDHAPLLRDLRETGPVFRRLDTHWTEPAGLAAIGQMLGRLTGHDHQVFSGAPVNQAGLGGDLADMILSPERETVPVLNQEDPAYTALLEANRFSGHGLVIHDSFYLTNWTALRALLPNARWHQHWEAMAGPEREELSQAEFVVFQSVERSLLTYLGNTHMLGWDGTLGQWLLDQSASAADRICELGAASPLAHTGPVQLPGSNTPLCLRVEVEADGPARLRLELERSGAGAGPFGEGRSVSWQLDSGASLILLTLPASMAGRTVRLNTEGPASITGFSAAR